MALRGRKGTFWPLKEILGDAVAPLRKEVDRFVEPFVQEGMKRKQEKEKGSGTDEIETLLDYLVDQTHGVFCLLLTSIFYVISLTLK